MIALGEAREASGDTDGAAASYDLARAETQLFVAAGVDVDLELALFEADQRRPAEGSRAGRGRLREPQDRPHGRCAGVGLPPRRTRVGRGAPVGRGASARDARSLLLYHAGMVALEAGDMATARDRLDAAITADPGFSATAAAAARRALTEIALRPEMLVTD